ncbi:hypothetical protein PVAND_015578 [Polypedilum vanderplanki]|uniref:Hydroxysteroid dehydrogenase-like protein 2 n=1 Tax=Polypedilum vanderplanki TaxID=319348 RepID=A0A9J6BD25_POLVA|nr:hypothetical protein PVAND_015578 [Polypedilum vanderplanki]
MINTGKLAGRTIFVSGASRGIGKAIALKAAADGANIVVAAKTAEPHPKLPGTIYTAAEEIEKAGGKALPCVVDVRDETQVRNAVEYAVKHFGGIDIVVNNASAIHLTTTPQTEMKRYDLMHGVIARGTYLVSKECLPYLKKSDNAHILNISPPLNLKAEWFANHLAYTMAKYSMSLCTLGMSQEFRKDNIGVNSLWPKTTVATAAMDFLAGKESFEFSRKPEIMSDAAYYILTKDPKTYTGNFSLDEQIILDAGIKDLKQYACNPENADKLMLDFFVEDVKSDANKSTETSSIGEGVIEKFFDKIEKQLTKEVVEKTDAIYQIELTGNESGIWHLNLKEFPVKTGKGTTEVSPDATLVLDSKDFVQMINGQLKPANAFLSGKLKIHGNMHKAMKVEKIMNSLKRS